MESIKLFKKQHNLSDAEFRSMLEKLREVKLWFLFNQVADDLGIDEIEKILKSPTQEKTDGNVKGHEKKKTKRKSKTNSSRKRTSKKLQ